MAWSFSRHSHESTSTRTDKDSGGDGFDCSVDILSGRQLLAVAEATAVQQPGIKEEVTAVAASKRSTRCQVQPADQLKKKAWLTNISYTAELLSIAGMTASWSCPTVVESIPRVTQ